MGVSKSLRKEVRGTIKKVFWATVRSFFLYPIVWGKRKKIVAMGPISENFNKDLPWWYWYGNSSEHVDGNPHLPLDYDACWYGDKGWRKRSLVARVFGKTYITSLVWNVFRNGVWNLRYKLGSKWRGPIREGSVKIYLNEDINGKNLGKRFALKWRNKSFGGANEVEFIYDLTGAPGYRISETKKRGSGYRNLMEGTGDGAAIYKRRKFKRYEEGYKGPNLTGIPVTRICGLEPDRRF